jgi:hypothetical protein
VTFWHKSTTPMMFAVVPTSSLTVFRHLHMAAGPKNNNRLEQITGKHNQQYITGQQDTFVIMGRTRYICYHRENKIHLF